MALISHNSSIETNILFEKFRINPTDSIFSELANSLGYSDANSFIKNLVKVETSYRLLMANNPSLNNLNKNEKVTKINNILTRDKYSFSNLSSVTQYRSADDCFSNAMFKHSNSISLCQSELIKDIVNFGGGGAVSIGGIGAGVGAGIRGVTVPFVGAVPGGIVGAFFGSWAGGVGGVSVAFQLYLQCSYRADLQKQKDLKDCKQNGKGF